MFAVWLPVLLFSHLVDPNFLAHLSANVAQSRLAVEAVTCGREAEEQRAMTGVSSREALDRMPPHLIAALIRSSCVRVRNSPSRRPFPSMRMTCNSGAQTGSETGDATERSSASRYQMRLPCELLAPIVVGGAWERDRIEQRSPPRPRMGSSVPRCAAASGKRRWRTQHRGGAMRSRECTAG